MEYLEAEHLTLKHTMFNRLLVIAPFCTAAFAFLAGGFSGLQYMGLYWWYAFLLQGTVAVLCVLSWQKEERAGKFCGIYSMPVDLRRFERAKNLVAAEKLLVSGIVLALFLSVPHLLSPQLVVYGVGKMFLGSILIILASLWQIPLCFMLVRKMGTVLPVIINTIVGLLTIAVIGNTPLWWVWPYCWPAKLAENFMGIGVNGVWAEEAANLPLVLAVLAASLLLFVLLTMFDEKNFAGGVRRR